MHTITADEIPDETNIKEKKYFDEKGNLIRTESFRKNMYSNFTEYQYGENDSIKKVSSYENSAQKKSETLFFFNSKNLREKEIDYQYGVVEDIVKYSYKGNQLVEISYFGNDSLSPLRKERKTYSNTGVLLKMESIDSFGVVTEITTYKCDSRGKIIEATSADNKGIRRNKWRYVYDADGKDISNVMLSDKNQPILIIETTYDSYGNVVNLITIVHEHIASVETSSNTIYTFDKNENWIKSVVTSKSKVNSKMSTLKSSDTTNVGITKRIIEYY